MTDEAINPDNETPDDLGQRIHEMIAAMHPEFCSPASDFANAKAAMQTLLAIHDMVVFEGALCEGMAGERLKD